MSGVLDSERTCVTCEHFRIHFGSPYYSEDTPGRDPSVGCAKDKYDIPDIRWEHQFREAIMTAEKCELYQIMKLHDPNDPNFNFHRRRKPNTP